MFGEWFGAVSSGGGGSVVVPATGTSTEADIRTRCASLLTALVPSVQSNVRFREHRYDQDFTTWCENNQECLRMFAIRDTLGPYQPAITNTDIEWRQVEVELLVAYPRTSRYGATKTDVSRDVLIRSDLHEIESTIGLRGYYNISDLASLLVDESRQDIIGLDETVAFLRFSYVFGFYRSMP
jgi:hypothetical protein